MATATRKSGYPKKKKKYSKEELIALLSNPAAMGVGTSPEPPSYSGMAESASEDLGGIGSSIGDFLDSVSSIDPAAVRDSVLSSLPRGKLMEEAQQRNLERQGIQKAETGPPEPTIRRIDPSKSAGVWDYDTMYPVVEGARRPKKQDKRTLEDLMNEVNSPAVQGSGPMRSTNPSLWEAAKGLVGAADWEGFGKGMDEYSPWGKEEGSEYSNPEAALIGTGRYMNKGTVGTADIYDSIRETVSRRGPIQDRFTQKRLDRREREAQKDKLYNEGISKDFPISTTIGEILPSVAPLGLGAVQKTGKVLGGLSKTYSKWDKAKDTKKLNDIARNKTISRAKGIPYKKEDYFSKGEKAEDWITKKWEKVPEVLKLPILEGTAGAVQGVTQYDDSALSGLLYGAGGGFVGKYIADLAGGAPVKLSPEVQRIVDNADRMGIYVPQGVRTGRASVSQLDNAVKANTNTQDTYFDITRNSKIKENNILADELGGDSTDYLTEEFLDATRERITNRMEFLAKDATGEFGDSATSKLDDIMEEFDSVNQELKLPPKLELHFNKIKDAIENGTPINGKDFQKATQALNKLSSKQYSGGDPDLGRAYKDLSEMYVDAIDSGAGGVGSEFKKSRRQYALLGAINDAKSRTVTKGMSGTDGFVDMNKVAKKFNSSDRINQIAELERQISSRPAASLGASQLVAKSLGNAAYKPNEAIGAANLLLGKMTKSIGGLDDFFTRMYMGGYGTTKGLIPGMQGRTDLVSKLPARALRARDGIFDKEVLDTVPEEESDEGSWETFEEGQVPQSREFKNYVPPSPSGMSIEVVDDEEGEWISY